MNPVAIFRHFHSEGPGYFATFLERHGIPWQLVKIDAGDAVPPNVNAYSGLAFMGGPMSVNDELPWIAPILELIRDAVRKDVPLLGHCLGGQLMSRALGGTVQAPKVSLPREAMTRQLEQAVPSRGELEEKARQGLQRWLGR